MDDHSDDRTWSILEEYSRRNDPRFKAMRSRPLPSGWNGKNWVCHQLSMEATGEWLLFTDADTIHGRDSICTAYDECIARGAHLASYLPDLITVSPIERIVIPVIYFAFYLLLPLGLLGRIGDRRAALAIGTFILVNGETYGRVGGHQALRDEIVEDMYLARMVKGEGKGVALLDGRGLLSTRFYTNARDIWKGFTKNTFGVFGYSILPFILFMGVFGMVFLNPFVRIVLHPAGGVFSPPFLQAAIILLLRLLVALRARHSLLSVVLHPVMIGFALGFAFNSCLRIFRGETVSWKGREYRISR